MGKYGSEDFKSRRTSKLHDFSKVTKIVHDKLGPFWIWNQFTVDNGGVSRGRSVAVGVSDRWKVTCDT